jgi:NAD(P)-dependent dehydrogenase (short-subunit alcohol dehydrogenase family)
VTLRSLEHVVVVGGSSGIGLGVAEAVLNSGAEVTIVGRSADRLAAAERRLAQPDGTQPDRLHAVPADITREDNIVRLFAATGPIDHVVTTAADLDGANTPIGETDPAAVRRVVESKLIGPFLLAKHAAPVLRPGGSITFTSGIAAYRPGPSGVLVAAVNGALAALARALAVELGPIRVNVVSPGWVDTPIWDAVAGAKKASTLEAMGRRLPVGRTGRPADIADAVRMLMHNGFITGTVLHVDGGHRLV